MKHFIELMVYIIKKYSTIAFIWGAIVLFSADKGEGDIRKAFVNGVIWPVSIYTEYFTDHNLQEDKLALVESIIEENTALKKELALHNITTEPEAKTFDPNAVPMD